MLLQAGVGPLSVLGTFLGIAAFLSLTAHLADRNVLGEVSPRRALGLVAPPDREPVQDDRGRGSAATESAGCSHEVGWMASTRSRRGALSSRF